MAKHIPFGKTAECSMNPVFKCTKCGQKLYSERSVRSNWKEWLITEDFLKRHFKSRCKTVPLKVGMDGQALKGVTDGE